ncbi:MAG TPA: multicopper oxidase domain-containing protein, partial [Azospirillaceae bacterium]|nr:multicopper oxidase domain-containing protein [Azospirillaceae bacterium]
ANFAAPTIVVDEGDELYLTLSNVGMARRPDLSDPHTVHWHGFPQAAAIFDGVPEASVAPNLAASFTYYYNVVEPGTYMFHCHMEATEHMQMGMLGNLYVRPRQNRLPAGTQLGSHVHAEGDTYVYNDGDGSTRYDVEVPIQIHSFDPAFHDASMATQPLPFALMKDTFPMLNGRGYPETINPNPLANTENGILSQRTPALVEARQGERILLRLSNLSVTRYFTLSASGLPMEVVGHGARILKGGGQATGTTLYYKATSVTLGGGEARDVIIDTKDIPAGTYFLHATELNYLSNDQEDHGGMMTEIVIRPGAA